MAAAPAPDPSTAPTPPPPPPSGGPIPPRPSPAAPPLRPPISRPVLSPTPSNKSALVSANRAAMRALSVSSRPLSAIDQAAASYLRRPPPPPPPLAPPPVSAVEQAVWSNPPARPTPPQPQPQPQPQAQPQAQVREPLQPLQPQPQPQPQQQFVPPPRPISAPRTVPPIRMVPKVTSYPVVSSVPEFNNRKDRERREINVATIRSRKVRLFERGSDSLYALCRSWLRNGLPQDCQPNYGDGVKLLPRPFPASLIDSNSSERSEGDNEADDLEQEERVGSAEELSTQDLLAGLVKRSKRVRQKLKKERDRRIARYNQRLSLLIPPVDMARSDATPGS